MSNTPFYCTSCGQATAQITDNCFVCSNDHHNYVNPAPAAGAFIIHDGKVLYGVRSIEPHPNKLGIAGGFIEMRESVESAIVREAKEELGVDIILDHYLGSYPSTYGDGGQGVLNIAFVAHLSGPDQNITPGDDMNGGEPQWRTLDNLPTEHELAWKWQFEAQKDLSQYVASHNIEL